MDLISQSCHIQYDYMLNFSAKIIPFYESLQLAPIPSFPQILLLDLGEGNVEYL